MPDLGDLFFAVCQTAIQNSAWKHADFERVKFVEGQLDALREFVMLKGLAETPNFELTGGETQTHTEIAEKPQGEAPVSSQEAPAKVLKPEEVKDLPDRPMPEEILASVQDGIELAKNPPKVAEVHVEELSDDPDIAREQFSR